MKRFYIIAALAIATSANAQEFSGKCSNYTGQGKDACLATQWCSWRSSKAISLPDGSSIAPKSTCAFKPNFGKAYAEKMQGKVPQ